MLFEYTDQKSEAAFAALVERHLPVVYSAALRQTEDAALTENLAHVVFILLAQRCHHFPPQVVLVDWLVATTRKVIELNLGSDLRRRRFERKAVVVNTARPAALWEQWLDEALAQLTDRERCAVLLHYFQFKRPGEVGLALGISEDAAQQSLAQAIGRLHRLFLQRGVAMPESVLPGLLMTRGARTPPSYLGPSVIAAALNQCALSTAVFALLQGAGREPVWLRLKQRLRKLAEVALLMRVVGRSRPVLKQTIG